jgi:hypothetical protein
MGMEDSNTNETTPDTSCYRIVKKRNLVLLVLLVTALAAVPAGLFRTWVRSYLGQISTLGETHPLVALDQLVFLVQTVFGATTVVLLSMAAFVGWYGFRILRSGLVPPPGAWLLEGQSPAGGLHAERAGKIHMLVCSLLATAGIVTFALGHKLVDQIPFSPHTGITQTASHCDVSGVPTSPTTPLDAGPCRS